MGTWVQAVLQMANFYKANVHTYQGTTSKPRRGRKAYPCSLLGHPVYDDCSGFTSACLLLFGAFSSTEVPTSGNFATASGITASDLRRGGFSPYTFRKENLQPFDIVAKNGHVEIFAYRSGNTYKSYAWGNIHDMAHGGLPCYYCNDHYSMIWRNSGVSIDTPIDFSTNDNMQMYMNNNYGSGSYSGTGVQSSQYNYTASNYPSHEEYDMFTGTGGSVFEIAKDNAITFAYMNSSTDTISNEHTRIYSTNDSSIVLDELSLPVDVSEGNSWANKGITADSSTIKNKS